MDKREEQSAVYANRRRVRGERSRRLQKRRGELVERSFAHCYETGALRRVYVRGTAKVLKRVLVQAAGFNIGLLLRKLTGWGKPRHAQGRENAVLALLFAVFAFPAARNLVTRFYAQACRGIQSFSKSSYCHGLLDPLQP